MVAPFAELGDHYAKNVVRQTFAHALELLEQRAPHNGAGLIA